MGFSFSRSSVSITQRVTNSYLDATQNQCYSSNSGTIEGNTANIGGDAGDVTVFNISGSMNSTCTINQQIVQTVTSMLQAASNQNNSTTEGLGGLLQIAGNFNSTDIHQSIMNSITNLTTNTCVATNTNNIENNVLNVAGNTGNINAFNINSDTNAVCTVTNMVSQVASNQTSANNDQSNIIDSSMLSILTTVIILAIIGFVIVAVLFGAGFLGFEMVGSKKKAGPPTNDQTKEMAEPEDAAISQIETELASASEEPST